MKDFYARHYLNLRPTAPQSTDDALTSMKTRGHRYFCIFDRLPVRVDLSAAELGFGAPATSNALAREFGSYVATDIAADAILKAHSGSIGFKCIGADLNEDFPFPSDSFDAVIAMMVFEHLFDPFHSFRETARILKPGGLAFVNLPIITSFKNRLRLLAGKLPMTSSRKWWEMREWDGGHLHYFDIPHVRRVADLFGLDMEGLYPVGSRYGIKRLAPQLLCGELSFVFSKRPVRSHRF